MLLNNSFKLKRTGFLQLMCFDLIIRLIPGVNLANIIPAAFMPKDHKSAKRSSQVKVACKHVGEIGT